MLTSTDPLTLLRSVAACPCKANKRALLRSIESNWLPATASRFRVKAASPLSVEELVQASMVDVYRAVYRLLGKPYAKPAHFRADIGQIAIKAMTRAADDQRPSGIGVTAGARYQRRRRGTAETRSSDPTTERLSANYSPRRLSRGRTDAEHDFLDWFWVAVDDQVADWLEWEAILLIAAEPAFGVGEWGRPNVAAVARYLGVEPAFLRERLKRLGQRVAAACDNPVRKKILEKLLDF
ncbi:hypothetical protein [Lacipirellula parvula]|uniref:Uncharacterized protein n=1 Tax=Lacipirellula parvula TaxID=2650471 RepID=A0A5K7XLX2_9BACT|nr:hypothetical protein [Lacipirellula parvula]BBO35533.1 hypothetical protein PLANPX_5145 [Lacipirellula parvula]